MTKVKIRKGHSIRIAGAPKNEIITNSANTEVALIPIEYKYIKPKLLVKEGDHVKIGSPLFFNKKNSEQKWSAPGHFAMNSSICQCLSE